MFLLLVILSFANAENLKCSNDPIRLSAGDVFTIDIQDDDFQLDCNYQFIPDIYIIPVLTFSQELKITDYVNISSQATPFAAERTLGIGTLYPELIKNRETDGFDDEFNYVWIPAPFNITFFLTEEGLRDEYLVITITGEDIVNARNFVNTALSSILFQVFKSKH